MSTQMVQQKTFTFGEVDQTNWKRTDIQEYLNCAQSLLNCEIGTTGLIKKRKGTTILANVLGYAQANSKMYEFVDKFGNYYVIISSNFLFTVFAVPSDEEYVIIANDNFVVTSRGNNVVINTSQASIVQTIASPYPTGSLSNIDYTQDGDNLILTNPGYPPGRIYIVQYNANNYPTFGFEYLNIYPLPAYDFNTINYNSFTVALSVTGNQLTFQFTGLASDPGFTSEWVGGVIIGGGASVEQPIGYAIITAVSYGGGTTTFTATVQIPFATTDYATQGSQYSIRQPAWSAALGYPAKVAYYQNRLWLANTPTLSNTIFGSQVNEPINFDVGIGSDSDAIVYTIGQNSSGSILWINGGKQLEIYCENLEFACPQDLNVGITPSTFAVRQQSSYGASPNLKPVTYLNDSYFANKTGKALINFHFTGIGLTYAASNISAQSSHLVKNPTNRALLRGDIDAQDNFIYFINPSDDTLTSFQFASEYKLAALTPIDFQDNVELIDICTVANQVYLLKYYSLSNVYGLEVLDDSQRVDMANQANMASNGVINDIFIYNGYTVQVVYEGQDYGQYLVQNNQITVFNPQGIAAEVTLGLLYDVEIVPMYIYISAVASPFKKAITRIYVDYYNSLNFSINGNLVPYQTFDNIQAGLPLTPQTNTAIVEPMQGYLRYETLKITQSSPFDLQITGIMYQVTSSVI